MDASRFDRWTRGLADASPRRHALKTLVGSAVTGLLVLVGTEEAAAACRANNKDCRRDNQCCSLNCRRDQCRCARVQQRCQSTKGCCQGGDAAVCDTVIGRPGDRCCRQVGSSCSSPFDCCGALLCNAQDQCA